MSNKKIVLSAVGLTAVAVLVLAYFYFLKPKTEGTIETAKKAGESVPEIVTNPAEKVPEVNPLDRANPFKYNNPLR